MKAPPRPASITASFTDYPTFVEALRTMKDHLQLSNATVDTLCGMIDGHTDKLLGPTCARALSPKSFGDLMWVFALKGTLEIDMDRVREMEQHWEQRCAANTRTTPNRISKKVVSAAKPIVLKENGRLGGMVTAALRTAAQRSASARKAARKSPRLMALPPERREEIARKAGLASAAKRKEQDGLKSVLHPR